MPFYTHYVFAEVHNCHENSLAFTCDMCNTFFCSHCSNATANDLGHHACDHNHLTHIFEIDNNFDHLLEELGIENNYNVPNWFDVESDDESDDDQDYHLDNIASGGRSADNGSHFMSFSGRNI